MEINGNKDKATLAELENRDQHALYQFLAHTALLPTDPEKPVFRFRVKKRLDNISIGTFKVTFLVLMRVALAGNEFCLEEPLIPP